MSGMNIPLAPTPDPKTGPSRLLPKWEQTSWFPGQVVWIKFSGTHGSYDRLDLEKL
jgi:hypothetical protein